MGKWRDHCAFLCGWARLFAFLQGGKKNDGVGCTNSAWVGLLGWDMGLEIGIVVVVQKMWGCKIMRHSRGEKACACCYESVEYTGILAFIKLVPKTFRIFHI